MSDETRERVATLQSIFRTWFDGFAEVALTTVGVRVPAVGEQSSDSVGVFLLRGC
jgi:hypothetical protein